jgi:hypothetical protein
LNNSLGCSIYELPNSFDGLNMLTAKPGLGATSANIHDVDGPSCQGRKSHCLPNDGAASRIPRAVDF